MNKQEFAMIASGIKRFYNFDYVFPDKETVLAWASMLSDIDYNTMNLAVQKWVLTNPKPPTLADLRSMCAEVEQGTQLDYGDGWGQVTKAIGRFGMYREAEAMESFDAITRECVKRLGWRNICTSENQTADRARFGDIYKQIAKRDADSRAMPEALKNMIAQAQAQNKNMIGDKQNDEGHRIEG